MSYSVLSSITVQGAFAEALRTAQESDNAARRLSQAKPDHRAGSLKLQSWGAWAKTMLSRRPATEDGCGKAA